MSYRDRVDAGQRLAGRLMFLQGQNLVVLGLPRGGVPVAYQIAAALNAPLDVIVVRKLGVPFQPELGMGAVAEGGVRVVNDQVVAMANVSESELWAVEAREKAVVAQRASDLRHGRSPMSLLGRVAVVVDDGMATGSTARAACRAAKARGAERVILAVPVASPEAVADLSREAEVICLQAPRNLWAVGQWYEDFSQTSDREVVELLDKAALARAPETAPSGSEQPRQDPGSGRSSLEIDIAGVSLQGDLNVPDGAAGLVIFAHGSGSSRHSPRNRFVAARLNEARLATLLFDLLTSSEEADRRNVFDIELLAGRLVEVTTWVREHTDGGRPIAYFGASTGAAAALWAAAEPGADIAAVVSRGGRPDLAGPRLAAVRAPTLLIVGGEDREVLRLNEGAQAKLVCENRLAVVPGATHLFEEPGTLAEASDLAKRWFQDHLRSQRPAA